MDAFRAAGRLRAGSVRARVLDSPASRHATAARAGPSDEPGAGFSSPPRDAAGWLRDARVAWAQTTFYLFDADSWR